MPRHANGAGVEMRGETVGMLTHWIPTVDGDWLGMSPTPIAMVSDNGPCFRGEVFRTAFAGPDPLPRLLRARARSPQTNGVIARFFGTSEYERLSAA
ncbi:hypothetical protein IU450_36005 [Nocardia abscessus]|uniref:hypothetical protein n=1 Tax=Nocardia abscessus TaxID=120957 RepID=UPI001894E631|nr:hypothetical protein [Nocardia abscessus]MBF6341246.1 hypothetical protein [Nocardia abscessus]